MKRPFVVVYAMMHAEVIDDEEDFTFAAPDESLEKADEGIGIQRIFVDRPLHPALIIGRADDAGVERLAAYLFLHLSWPSNRWPLFPLLHLSV